MTRKPIQLDIFKDVELHFDTGRSKDALLTIHKTLFTHK